MMEQPFQVSRGLLQADSSPRPQSSSPRPQSSSPRPQSSSPRPQSRPTLDPPHTRIQSSAEILEKGCEQDIWANPAAEKQAQPWEASLSLEVQPDLVTSSEGQRTTTRLVIKRKVLRHKPDGGVEICESVSSEPKPNTTTWSLNNKMRQLRLDSKDSISEGAIETSSSSSSKYHPCSYCGDRLNFLLREIRSQCSLDSQDRAAGGQPKSFIRQRFLLGHYRGKTDNVARYFEYKQEWDKFRMPGQDQRLDVRWAIRQKMLCEPELPRRPQHPMVHNTYTVPTEKKRAALCWKVRWDMAMGQVPQKHPPS